MLAFPLLAGVNQPPAAPCKSCCKVLPVGCPLKAHRPMGAGLNAVPAESGREMAQIIGSDEEFGPFDEMLVKKPGSWLPPIEPEVACWSSEREGDVCTFQRITPDPPLLTTCTVPSEK